MHIHLSEHFSYAKLLRFTFPTVVMLRRHEEALEHILQNKGHQGQGENTPVADGQGKHFSCGPQKEAEGLLPNHKTAGIPGGP